MFRGLAVNELFTNIVITNLSAQGSQGKRLKSIKLYEKGFVPGSFEHRDLSCFITKIAA